MLFRLTILALLCICALSMWTGVKEALTPCQRIKQEQEQEQEQQQQGNKSMSPSAANQTQHYIDPQDGSIKEVPKGTGAPPLPPNTVFVAVNKSGKWVQTNAQGVPLAQTDAVDDLAIKLAQARFDAKTAEISGAAYNIEQANELLKQQYDANREQADVLSNAQGVVTKSERIVADQQTRVMSQQATMRDLISRLQQSVYESDQASMVLEQAAILTSTASGAPATQPPPTALPPPPALPPKPPSLPPPPKPIELYRGAREPVAVGGNNGTVSCSTFCKGANGGPWHQNADTQFMKDNWKGGMCTGTDLPGVDCNAVPQKNVGCFCKEDVDKKGWPAPPQVPQAADSCLSSRMGGVCNNDMAAGRFVATMQADGNFVVYQKINFSGNVSSIGIFSSGTMYKGTGPYRLVMNGDGNLCAVDANNHTIWNSGTSNVPGFTAPYKAVMQQDGNFVVYDGNGRALWTTNTGGR